MGWQHFRYLNWRRTVIHDRQPLVYPASALHVLTVVRLAPGEDLIEAFKKLRAETEGAGGGQWIYAGKTVFIGLHSSQLGETAWDGAFLVQYPSREAYDEVAGTPAYREALGRFPETYSHGMKRPAALNLGLPMALLATHVRNVLTGAPIIDTDDPADPEELAERLASPGVAAAAPYGTQAMVVVNLVLNGDSAERKANSEYGSAMLSVMARGGHGPAHIGGALTLEGTARFDNVIIVYYPGVEYFIRLVSSKFFTGIVGNKQLGDSLAMPTVPILDRL